MNYSTAIFLINNHARALKVTYEDGANPEIVKTLDQTIKLDDYVVVETDTRHKMTVVKVVETDVDFDLEEEWQPETLHIDGVWRLYEITHCLMNGQKCDVAIIDNEGE